MKTISLNDITDDQLSSESALLVGLLRSKYPRLDLRKGTALRDLLVVPDASVGAMFSAQADEQRMSSSLSYLSERSADGQDIDEEDVNAALSNFNMSTIGGTRSRGFVRVVVSSGDRTHTVLSGVKFRTVDDRLFTVTSDVVASETPNAELGETRQYRSDGDTYWYLVPVEADETGSAGNLDQGDALDPDTSLADFLSASAYSTFSGGSDMEVLSDTVDRIKSSLSMRGLTTCTAVEAQLRDRYDDGDHPIVSVSVCGYGNKAQRRDKHNLFGVAVGGRADIYVRNFTDLPVSDIPSLTGKVVDRGYSDDSTRDFTINVPNTVVPGLIYVYSVSDPDANAIASYRFSTSFSGSTSYGWHDFSTPDGDAHELANTVWRSADILVKGVPVTQDDIDSGERQFRVSAVALPAADSIQGFVDDGMVRNVASDFVVRGPMIVNMSVNADVRYKFSTGFDTDKAKAEICRYVNRTGFPGRITRSEISAILIGLGAVSVDLFDENDMLSGYVYDAFGTRHSLNGDALDIDDIENPDALLTRDTAVFVIEPRNIQIRTTAV